tara:strand:+ start:983 stop:1204 length:222 start_codon:yes stop_codon:yes gene_type:complete
MIKINWTLTEVEKRTLKRMTLHQLATFCDNLEKDIEKSHNVKEIAGLRAELLQVERMFDNRMNRAENDLMDRN